MNEKTRSKEKGQSLVLVAAALVALVIFVAITVDVSSAYYNRRTAQNAADGAALAGASRLATQINNRVKLDGQIQIDMNDFAERNGIEDTNGTLKDVENENVDGWYVDTEANRIVVNGKEVMVGMAGKDGVPDDAYGIEAITYITAPTYFGGIFGFDGYPLQARAVSQVKLSCGDDCLVPIVTGMDLLLDDSNPPEPRLDECFHIWKERLINGDDDISQGLLGWVSWTWQQSVCEGAFPACEGVRPCPRIDQKSGCDNTVLVDNISPDVCASGFVKVGDWIAAAPGDMNSEGVRCALDYYVGNPDPISADCTDGEPHSFTVPVYDITTADEGVKNSTCGAMSDPCDISDITPTYSLHYHVAGFARMQVIQYQLSSGQEYPSDEDLAPGVLDRVNECKDYLDFMVNVPTPEPGAEPTPTPEPPDGFRITVEFLEYVTDYTGSNECYDPTGTLWSSPKLTE